MEQQHLTDSPPTANCDGVYRVEQVLKSAAYETTELVSFPGSGGEPIGPFVRKRIARDARLGSVYERIFTAQQAGRRFLHLPRILEVYQDDRELIVVMEFVAGEPLSRVLDERERGTALAERVFPAVCDAVIELHEMFDPPIIHRDLKPSNIIVAGLGDDPIATLIDLSISRVHAPGATSDTTHFGTLCFAPPEQFGCQQTDVRSDVYALGMILRLLLTQESCSSPGAAGEPDPSLDALPALRAVVVRAASFDPAGRYDGVAELREAFGRACAACRTDGDAASVGLSAETRAHGDIPASRPVSTVSAPPCGRPVRLRRFAGPARGREPSAACDRRGGGIVRGSRVVRALEGPVSGRIWNALVIATVVLLCIASVELVAHPTGTAAQMTLSERIAIGIVVMVPNFVSIGYLLLDKRRLRTRLGWLAGRTGRRDLILAAEVFGVTMAVAIIAELLSNG